MTRQRAKEILGINISPAISWPVIISVISFAVSWGRAERTLAEKADKSELVAVESELSKRIARDSARREQDKKELENDIYEVLVLTRDTHLRVRQMYCRGKGPECR